MSTLFVNKIVEETPGNGVAIPGHIIQTTRSVITSNVQATSSSYLDVGHSLVITPKFSNSIILLQNSAAGWQYNAGSPTTAGIRIKRSGSVILTNDGQGLSEDGTWNSMSWVFSFFDTTHASTSALTYTLEINGNRARFNDNNGALNTSTFLAMEIAQ
jgi:hypothetical protein